MSNFDLFIMPVASKFKNNTVHKYVVNPIV